jgi:hypothetical protein
MIVQLTEKNGTKYRIPSTMDYYILPRTEWLLHQVKEIERKLLKWYEENKYNQGDSYSVTICRNGKWKVSHSNDYPMQHGAGGSHIFSDGDFAAAMKMND